METKEIMLYLFSRISTDEKLRVNFVETMMQDKDLENAFIAALDKIAEEIKRQKNARQVDKNVDTKLSDANHKD